MIKKIIQYINREKYPGLNTISIILHRVLNTEHETVKVAKLEGITYEAKM
jgi:hypothetical protein